MPTLHGIDLQLEPGRVIGLIGANDAGKSTLCLCAVGLAPNVIGGELKGKVAIDDLDDIRQSDAPACPARGILFQNRRRSCPAARRPFGRKSRSGHATFHSAWTRSWQRTWSAIHAMRLDSIVDRDPSRLSGGQAQLVALAAVLALGPRYLVLDEPTSQLDPLGTRLVGDTLAQTARETNVGILIAEHKTDLLAQLCDEIVVLDKGRLVARGTADDVLRRPQCWASSGVAPLPT